MILNNIEISIPSNNPYDFYLQWDEIYWWQMKFEIDSEIRKSINDLNENMG